MVCPLYASGNIYFGLVAIDSGILIHYFSLQLLPVLVPLQASIAVNSLAPGYPPWDVAMPI